MKDNDLNAICNPILGKNLLEIYPEYSKIIFPDFVSQTPGVAIERINNYFEVQPGDFRQTDPFISLQIDPLELTTVFTIMR